MLAVHERGLLLASIVLVGCGAVDASHAEDSSSDIVGGTSDDQHASVALIRFTMVDDTGSQRELYCTGSLVASNIVLTAGHCVVPSSGHISDWTVSFAATTNTDGGMVDPIRVTKAVPHPDFKGGFGNGDVALLFLETSPAGLRPMPIVQHLGDAAGNAITFVGYGAVGASADGSELIGGNDRRRSVTTTVSAVSDTFLEYRGEKGLCGGDSGGPALMTIDGVETIVGTNDLAGVGCDTNGAALRIDDTSTVRDFLAANIPGVSVGVGAEPGSDGGTEAGAPGD
jgi:hypothetical protein